MRVDPLDNTLICNNDDLQISLCLHRGDCVLPVEIELGLLRIAYEAEDIEPYTGESIEDAFEHMPKRLLNRIVAQINELFIKQEVDYTGRHLAYMLYYLPINVYKVWKPMSDLLVGNLLKRNLRILDVGTGPGSISVGIIEFYRRLATSYPGISFSLEFTLLDRQKEFIALADKIVSMACAHIPGNLRVTVSEYLHQHIAAENCSQISRVYDIITLSNVLTANEGCDGKFAENLLWRLAECLASDGAIILIEPGDKSNGVNLKELRNSLANGHIYNVYSPCIDIWSEGKPYECACFNPTRCYWALPKIHRCLLSRGVKRKNRNNVPFHYVVLRKDAKRKYSVTPSLSHYVKLKDLQARDGQVLNVIAMVQNVFEEGDQIKLLLCDGTNRAKVCSPEVRLIVSRECLREMGLDIRFLAAERITAKRVRVFAERGITLRPTKEVKIQIDY